MENIWILFTNTNVVWDFETNVDMELDITESKKNMLANLSNSSPIC